MFTNFEKAQSAALQGIGTNALVDNPFVFEDSNEKPSTSALQGLGTNAIVENPFK